VKGIAPRCCGVIIPVFTDGPDHSVIPCSQVDLARAITLAIDYARKRSCKGLIVNISGGQFSSSGEAHPLLADVIRDCNQQKVLIIAAAGNQGCDCLHVPGAVENVLAVGAMNQAGEPKDFSNWGERYRRQGVLAPGERIKGASPGHITSIRTGTSFATPIVSGVAALLMSLQSLNGKPISAAIVKDALLKTADGCDDDESTECQKLLAGRLKIPKATLFVLERTGIMGDNVDLSVQPSESVMNGEAPQPSTRLNRPFDIPPAVLPAECAVAPAVLPSDCGCGGGAKPNANGPQKVFAIGKLSYDFGTRSRREYFRNAVRSAPLNIGVPNVDSAEDMYRYLTHRPSVAGDYTILNGPVFGARTDVTSLIWILEIDETPVYAIAPRGPFSEDIYDILVSFLGDQLPEPDPNDSRVEGPKVGKGAERMSLAGTIAGSTRLFTGETVPVVVPDHRGMANWTTAILLNTISRMVGAGENAQAAMRIFLDRIFEQTRNLGLTPQDRALNYAVTDSLFVQGIFANEAEDKPFSGLELDTITVTKSPICRPDYDCWDISIIFFNPNNLMQSRRAVRYTIDVSDVVPIIVAGSKRSFTLR
jgi:hypothetical protein